MDKIHELWPSWYTEELIGEGAFGKVYKVKRTNMGNISYSAVKIIHIPHDNSQIKELQYSGMDFHSIHSYFEDMVKNLLNEIQIMEDLKTATNIVTIEDYEVLSKEGEIGWDIYIRMELLKNLSSYKKELTEQDVIKMGMDICDALSACEKVGVIHRDIKIDNIFVNEFDSFKLGDFGISKRLEQTRLALTQKGTNKYIAPEVFQGKAYDKTVDIYSLGITMYRLLNGGRFPFEPSPDQKIIYGDDEQRAFIRRLSGEKIPAPKFADEALAKIICKACEFQKNDRYQSAAEFKEGLKNYSDKELTKQEESVSANLYDFSDERTRGAFASGASFHDSDDSKYRLAGRQIVQDTTEEKKKENLDSERISLNEHETKYKVEEDFREEDSYKKRESQEKPTRKMPERPAAMKWYKFQIWFQLPAAAVCYLYYSFLGVSGLFLSEWDIARIPLVVLVFVSTLCAVLMFRFWWQMKKFYQNSWKKILILQGAFAATWNLLILIEGMIEGIIWVTQMSSIAVSLFEYVVYISLNYLYYKKRDYLFVQ